MRSAYDQALAAVAVVHHGTRRILPTRGHMRTMT